MLRRWEGLLLDLNLRAEGTWSVVTVVGRLDTVAAPRFEERCDEWIAEGRTRIVLDFSQLQYISSAGLGSLAGLAKKLTAREGRLAVAGTKGIIKEVFSITGFDAIIPTHDSVEDALSAG